MRRFTTNSAAETEQAGARLARRLKGGDVVAVYGGLGAGKTVFVRGIAAGLGITDEVSSPTFALVHEYGGEPLLAHFDMYRVEGWEDLYSTGFFDYLDRGGVLAVEWAENIEAALPENTIRVHIRKLDADSRLIEIDMP